MDLMESQGSKNQNVSKTGIKTNHLEDVGQWNKLGSNIPTFYKHGIMKKKLIHKNSFVLWVWWNIWKKYSKIRAVSPL